MRGEYPGCRGWADPRQEIRSPWSWQPAMRELGALIEEGGRQGKVIRAGLHQMLRLRLRSGASVCTISLDFVAHRAANELSHPQSCSSLFR